MLLSFPKVFTAWTVIRWKRTGRDSVRRKRTLVVLFATLTFFAVVWFSGYAIVLDFCLLWLVLRILMESTAEAPRQKGQPVLSLLLALPLSTTMKPLRWDQDRLVSLRVSCLCKDYEIAEPGQPSLPYVRERCMPYRSREEATGREGKAVEIDTGANLEKTLGESLPCICPVRRCTISGESAMFWIKKRYECQWHARVMQSTTKKFLPRQTFRFHICYA